MKSYFFVNVLTYTNIQNVNNNVKKSVEVVPLNNNYRWHIFIKEETPEYQFSLQVFLCFEEKNKNSTMKINV